MSNSAMNRLRRCNGVWRELEDLSLFLLMLPICGLCWSLFFGLRWDDVLPSYDAMLQSLPWIHDFIEQKNFDWHSLLYRTKMLGGVPIFESYGSLPVIRLLARLSYLDEGDIINLHYLFLQSLFGFWTMRACLDLKEITKPHRDGRQTDPRASWYPSVIVYGVLGAFAPVVWWRVLYGHSSMLAALLVIPTMLALGLALLRGRLSMVELGIGFFCIYQSLQGHGYQILLYSALLGGPLVLATLWSVAPPKRKNIKVMAGIIGLWTMLVASGLLVASPMIYVMVQNVVGGDTLRGLREPAITYSYIISTANDWLGSITWSNIFPLGERKADLLHETNYPIGPLMVFFIPWLRKKSMAIAYGASIVILVVFSCKVEPFATAILHFVPALSWFRVPARACLPIIMAIGILACGRLFCAVDHARPSGFFRDTCLPWLLMSGLCLFLGLSEPSLRELMLWGIALAVAVIKPPRNWVTAAAAALAFGCLMVDKDNHWLPCWSDNQVIALNHKLGTDIKSLVPELASPLYRATITSDELIIGGPNGPYLAGISTLDGYMVPTSRYARLLAALGGQSIPAGTEVFHVESSSEDINILLRLYNVCTNLSFSNNAIQVRREDFCAGPAWLSRELKSMPNIGIVGGYLLAGGAEADRLRQRAVVAEDDPKVTEVVNATPAKKCLGGTIGFVQSKIQKHFVSFWTPTSGDCTFTLAINYSDIIKARVADKRGVWSAIVPFPIYGSLIGLLLPSGTTMIEIEPQTDNVGWLNVLPWLGVLCLVAMFGIFLGGAELLLQRLRRQRLQDVGNGVSHEWH